MKIVVVGNFPRWLVSFRGPLLRAMKGRGHHVHAGAPDASRKVREALAAMGVIYEDIPVDRDGMSMVDDGVLFYRLFRLFRRIKPDLVLSYTVKPVIYGSLAAWLAGVPARFSLVEGLGYVFTGLNRDRFFLRTVISFLYAVSLRLNRKVFFLNAHDLDYFLGHRILPGRQAGVLLRGIGIDLYDYFPAPLPVGISFLFAARLIEDKGIVEYVEAARMIRRQYPDVVFRVAGWIDENPSAISRSRFDDWVREGVIEYLGNLETIRDALASSTALVLPTFYREGLPRSILEAMAMGRPVITTSIPGCMDAVLDGRTGFLVPVKSSEAVARAMETLILDPGLASRMGEAGRRRAVTCFDVRSVNQRLMAVMGLE
ncbi:MAG: glycosyltransferase family 4 protein [Pseudomonadota bacterium]